ncbi:MAG: NADH-quinone oxidoreductase subunit L [Phycisphaerales bacterium]|nr:NADH-quinone oxidoreductase subunit L [Phycisphaerales bacterium]
MNSGSIIPVLNLLAAGAEEGHASAGPVAHGPWWVALIVVLPMLGAMLCGAAAALKVRSKLPAFLTVGLLGASCALAVSMYLELAGGRSITVSYRWIDFAWGTGEGQRLVANFGFYIDSLTCLWMLFVTGLATLIALYASEYMSHDQGVGYCRFFAAFNLFVFSMACLVMGDNLLLLYLGWEGVGLCSYLLIGYFYKRPAAVAAAKKAFIVNRIGDLALALGTMLAFVHFGSVEYAVIFAKAQPYIEAIKSGHLDQVPFVVQVIPLLFMVGAFGKSAQLPLYVWLPDAMEGPTPVSALIHAATMVTAGVYLIARTYPIFLCSEYALPVVAWVGALTALLAATIGMAQFDIKRIMAYSTVSQLGYMFAGLAFLSSAGAAYHVFTHAFFKATLFLCCGAVMHGFAGQLDLRKLSGVAFMKGWGIVGLAMLIGCLNLAGVPFTAGFFSKDMILAESFVTMGPGYQVLGWVLLLTAGLTAYYTFRVFFRVFVGPKTFEPGDELHAHDDHGHDAHGHDSRGDAHAEAEHGPAGHAAPGHGHDFHPHAPGWAINLVLLILAAASIAAALPYFMGEHGGWVPKLVHESSATTISDGHGSTAAFLASGLHEPGASAHGTLFGQDPHKIMYYVSGAIGAVGIAIAFVLHYAGRKTAGTSRADALVPALGPVAGWARRKWLVDELYDALVRTPLWVLSHVFHLIDKLLIDGLVNLFGWLPRAAAQRLRPTQGGDLHGYAAGMAVGLGAVLILVWMLIL